MLLLKTLKNHSKANDSKTAITPEKYNCGGGAKTRMCGISNRCDVNK
jgi:hypothetical protein